MSAIYMKPFLLAVRGTVALKKMAYCVFVVRDTTLLAFNLLSFKEL